MPAIIVLTGKTGERKYDEPVYHGVFVDGDAATKWGFANLKAFDWHWQEISLQTKENGEIELRG